MFQLCLLFLLFPEFFWDICVSRALVRVQRHFLLSQLTGILLMESRLARKNLEKIRIQAIKLFLAGVKCTLIASQLQVKLPTVHLWIRRFKKQSWDGLRAKPHKGRPKINNHDFLEQIRDDFSRHQNSQGPNPKLWTGPEILKILKSKWNITLNPKYIYRWLRRNQMENFLAQNSSQLVELK